MVETLEIGHALDSARAAGSNPTAGWRGRRGQLDGRAFEAERPSSPRGLERDTRTGCGNGGVYGPVAV